APGAERDAVRTFDVPLQWISWVGTLLGLLVLFSIFSIFIAGKYYWISQRSSSTRVDELEQKIVQLKTSIAEQEKRGVQPQGAQPAPVSSNSDSDGLTLIAFQNGVHLDAPDPSTLAFSIRNPRAYWSGNTLKVRLSLQYTKGDEGNQQGFIIALSRGPDGLMAYPSGVLDTKQKKILIDISKGESFSVSRFREVKADFPGRPPRSTAGDTQENPRSVEVYLFNKDFQLLHTVSLTPEDPRRISPDPDTNQGTANDQNAS
ncbi:MAG: hypothetical protein HYX41_06530, partial [Bdellovibrio sp.]|nr:hypothetical protein [Bdellovibrio sp.]